MFDALNTNPYSITIYNSTGDSIEIPARSQIPVDDSFLDRLPFGVIVAAERTTETIFDGEDADYFGPFDSTNTIYKQIGEPNHNVIIVKNGVVQGTTQTDDEGKFSFTFGSPVLPDDIVYPLYVKVGRTFKVINDADAVIIPPPGGDGDFLPIVASLYSLGFL